MLWRLKEGELRRMAARALGLRLEKWEASWILEQFSIILRALPNEGELEGVSPSFTPERKGKGLEG